MGYQDSRKSMSSYNFILAGGAILWKSSKQSFVISSTIEAEFVAFYETLNHAIWPWNFISGVQVVDEIERPLKLFYNNKATVLYSNNSGSSL